MLFILIILCDLVDNLSLHASLCSGYVLHTEHPQSGHGQAAGRPDRPGGLYLRSREGPEERSGGVQRRGRSRAHHHRQWRRLRIYQGKGRQEVGSQKHKPFVKGVRMC